MSGKPGPDLDLRVEGGFAGSVLRWAIFLSLSVAIVVVAALVLVPFGGGAAHRLHLFWARLCLRIFGIRLTLEHPDRIVRGRPVIYFANHQSFADIMILGAALRTRFAWLAKAELFKIPILGWGMRRTGYIPVHRGQSALARDSFYKAADRVREGTSLVVFPEATVTPDGNLLPFKDGGFLIALRAGVAIQPLTISGAFAVLPDQENRTVPRLRPGPVVLHAHKPLEFDEFAQLSPAELKAKVRTMIESRLPDSGAVARAPA